MRPNDITFEQIEGFVQWLGVPTLRLEREAPMVVVPALPDTGGAYRAR